MPDILDFSNSLTKLENELSKLQSATSIIADGKEFINQSVGTLREMSESMVDELNKTKESIDESMTKTRELSTSLVKNLTETSNFVVSESKQAVTDAVQDNISLHRASQDLIDKIGVLIIKIDEYEIPSHFEQLETKINAIENKIIDLKNQVTVVEKSLIDQIETNTAQITNRTTAASTWLKVSSVIIFLFIATVLLLNLLK